MSIARNNTEKDSLIDKDGRRRDGRTTDDLRPIRMQVGVLNRADGSSLIEWGNNKIIAAVYGPRELHPKHLALPEKVLVRCEYRMASFSVQERKSPAPKRREIELSKIIAEALEPAVFVDRYPRSAIDIYLTVLNADGGTRCASITAAALALADAGIPMRGLVTSVASGKVDGQVILDLSDVEDKEGEGDLPLAILNPTGEITLLQLDGVFSPAEFKKAVSKSIEACQTICEIQRQTLLENFASITELETEKIIESELEEEISEEESLGIEEENEEPETDMEEEDKIKIEAEPEDDYEEEFD